MPAPLPTARELQILRILWRKGRASVREVYEALHAGNTRLAYTTVLTVLQTMRRKNLVRHERAGKAHIYSASVQEADTLRGLAGGFLQRVFDGAVDQYLVRALEASRPTDEQLDRIQQLITAAKRPQKTTSPARSASDGRDLSTNTERKPSPLPKKRTRRSGNQGDSP